MAFDAIRAEFGKVVADRKLLLATQECEEVLEVSKRELVDEDPQRHGVVVVLEVGHANVAAVASRVALARAGVVGERIDHPAKVPLEGFLAAQVGAPAGVAGLVEVRLRPRVALAERVAYE